MDITREKANFVNPTVAMDVSICQTMYMGLLIVWILAELEATCGLRLMRNRILDVDRSSKGVPTFCKTGKRFLAFHKYDPMHGVQTANISPWIVRQVLMLSTALAAFLPESMIARAIVAFVTLAAGSWQHKRLGDHSMHLLGAATVLPALASDAMLGPLLRVVVAWHFGSSGVQKLRVGGLAWMSADSRRLNTSCLLLNLSVDEDRIGTVRLARFIMQQFIKLPNVALMIVGAMALAFEIVLPVFVSGLPHALFPWLRCFDSDVFHAAGFLMLHAGIWMCTGMMFWGNLAICAALSVCGNPVDPISGIPADPDLYYANIAYANILSVLLWTATYFYVEDWPLSHMGVFVYNKSQANQFSAAFQDKGLSYPGLPRKRVVAWAASDTGSSKDPYNGPSLGERVALNLGFPCANCTCLDLAASACRSCCNGTFPTYATKGFLDSVPDPHIDPWICATAAQNWLSANPLFFDAHLGLPLTNVSVVDVDDNGIIVKIHADSRATRKDVLKSVLKQSLPTLLKKREEDLKQPLMHC